MLLKQQLLLLLDAAVVNNTFVREAGIDYKALFTRKDR